MEPSRLVFEILGAVSSSSGGRKCRRNRDRRLNLARGGTVDRATFATELEEMHSLGVSSESSV